MKKNDISAYGVQGMSRQEMIQANGGIWGAIAVGVVWWLLSEFDSIVDGAHDGANGRYYDYQA